MFLSINDHLQKANDNTHTHTQFYSYYNPRSILFLGLAASRDFRIVLFAGCGFFCSLPELGIKNSSCPTAENKKFNFRTLFNLLNTNILQQFFL